MSQTKIVCCVANNVVALERAHSVMAKLHPAASSAQINDEIFQMGVRCVLTAAGIVTAVAPVGVDDEKDC